jgi:hypothetical protein
VDHDLGGVTVVICERCGRLLNRATGKCNVCADHGGAAPPPVATTTAAAGPDGPETTAAPPAAPPAPPPRLDPGERPTTMVGPGDRSIAATLRPAVPPPDRPVPPPASTPPGPPAAATPAAPAPPPDPDAPISVSAAVAILDVSDNKPARVRRASPPALVEPATPQPPPRAPGAPVGVIRGARMARRKVDLVAYDGNLVVAKRGAPENLTSGQLAAQDPGSRLLAADNVSDAIVREDAVSGQVRIHMAHTTEELVVRWPGWKNRGVSAENLLAHSFPGKVDQGSPEIAKRTIRVMAGLGGAILAAVVLYLGLSALLKGDPPPPPPPAPTTTLSPPEQAARAALQPVCPGWQQFAGGVAPGERPNPTALRPVADGMREAFVAAADAGADPLYATARDEVGYLQDYARRPVEDVARESVSRVAFAMRTVTSACDRAMR